MPVPAFVQAGTGAIWQSGAAVAVSLSGAVVGNFLALHIFCDAADAVPTLSSHSGVEDVSGTDNALTAWATAQAVGASSEGRQTVWFGRAISTSVSVNMAGAGTGDLYGRWYEFTGVDTTAVPSENLEDAGGFLNGAGTSAVIADSAVTTNGPNRLACQFVAVNDDNAVDAFTGMTGGTWAEAVAEFLSSTGTDGCIQLQTATMAAAGTINGGSFTMVASDAWGVIGLALKPQFSLVWQPAPATIARI